MLFLLYFLLFKLYLLLVVIQNHRDQSFISCDEVDNPPEVAAVVSPFLFSQTGRNLVFVAEDDDLGLALGIFKES